MNDPIEQYVTVMTDVVAEVRRVAARHGCAPDDVTDEDLLRGLLRLRDAVARAHRNTAVPSRAAG